MKDVRFRRMFMPPDRVQRKKPAVTAGFYESYGYYSFSAMNGEMSFISSSQLSL